MGRLHSVFGLDVDGEQVDSPSGGSWPALADCGDGRRTNLCVHERQRSQNASHNLMPSILSCHVVSTGAVSQPICFRPASRPL